MQFIDLKKQYQVLKKDIDKAILETIASSQFVMGEEVAMLEKELAEYVGRKFCITCANGTDALHLALMAYGVGKGDAVFIPTFTFYASAEVIEMVGATPIFVDIDPRTFNMEPLSLRDSIKRVEREGEYVPRAVIMVDLFGLPADAPSIESIAEEYNLLIVEDGAQGFGGSINYMKACSLGEVSTTSFFPAKPLGCYGDGGAIFTDKEEVKCILDSLRIHGKGKDKYDNVRVGLNSRLDTIQAGILRVKLKAFQEYELGKRQQVANLYRKLLGTIVTTPYIPDSCVSSYAQYSILLESEMQRDLMQRKLKEHSIPSMIYYKRAMHQQTVFRNNLSAYWGFPNAERVTETILSLPMHPYLQADEVEMVANVIIDGVV